jgi:hypothetical protein
MHLADMLPQTKPFQDHIVRDRSAYSSERRQSLATHVHGRDAGIGVNPIGFSGVGVTTI